MIVVHHLYTVIGMYTITAKLTIAGAQRILTHAVVVENHRNPRLGPPQNLSTQARLAAVSAIGLPAIDDPGFNLQLIGRKPLDTYAVKEPRSI